MSDDDHLHSIIADYGDAFAEMQAELDRLRANAVRRIEETDRVLVANGRLRTQLAEAKARVGELENKNSYNLQIVREATARIAELEATILHWTSEVARLTQNSCDDQDRAELAEAERDALHLFSGAQAAVIKEMREALELVLDVARAALAPSHAAKDVCNE